MGCDISKSQNRNRQLTLFKRVDEQIEFSEEIPPLESQIVSIDQVPKSVGDIDQIPLKETIVIENESREPMTPTFTTSNDSQQFTPPRSALNYKCSKDLMAEVPVLRLKKVHFSIAINQNTHLPDYKLRKKFNIDDLF